MARQCISQQWQAGMYTGESSPPSRNGEPKRAQAEPPGQPPRKRLDTVLQNLLENKDWKCLMAGISTSAWGHFDDRHPLVTLMPKTPIFTVSGPGRLGGGGGGLCERDLGGPLN